MLAVVYANSDNGECFSNQVSLDACYKAKASGFCDQKVRIDSILVKMGFGAVWRVPLLLNYQAQKGQSKSNFRISKWAR